MSTRYIQSEFPDHPGFPKAVRQLVANGEAEDASWHNDIAPSVERDVNGWIVRLWDYGDEDEGVRYFVTQWKPDSNEDDRDPVYTLDARQAVRTFRAWVRALLIESPSPVDEVEP